MTEQEEWRPVHGWESLYEVSNLGRMRRLERRIVQSNGVVRKWTAALQQPWLNSNGYPTLMLSSVSHEPVRLNNLVHVAVLEAFVGPRPEGMDACHWDGDRTNANLTNLRWGTRSENIADMIRHGRSPRTEVCVHGHAKTPENVYVSVGKGGSAFHCRTCALARAARQRAAKRAAKHATEDVA